MMIVRVQVEPLDSAAIFAELQLSGVGAVASFTGIVRGDDGVIAIALEHYPAMTEPSLSALVHEAWNRWQLAGCALIHRVGYLPIGEPIVLVATASPHRAAALEACAFLIDRLKIDAPFWKKEFLADGSERWVDAKVNDMVRNEKWM